MRWLRTSLAQPGAVHRRPDPVVRERQVVAAAVREVPPLQGRRVALWAEGQPTLATWARALVPTKARGVRLLQPCPAVDFLPAAPPACRAAPLPAAAAFPGPGRRSCRW